MAIKYNIEVTDQNVKGQATNEFITNILTVAGKREFLFPAVDVTDGTLTIPITNIGTISLILAEVSVASTATWDATARLHFTIAGVEVNAVTGASIDDSGPATFTGGAFDINGETVTVSGSASYGLEALCNDINTAGYSNGFSAYVTGEGTAVANLIILQPAGSNIVIDGVTTAVLAEFGLTAGTTTKSASYTFPLDGPFLWDVDSTNFGGSITGIGISTTSTDDVSVKVSVYGV